jgi:diguanylate cyclase (GGDEF)-like protein/PAS domain S-box-containing protein
MNRVVRSRAFVAGILIILLYIAASLAIYGLINHISNKAKINNSFYKRTLHLAKDFYFLNLLFLKQYKTVNHSAKSKRLNLRNNAQINSKLSAKPNHRLNTRADKLISRLKSKINSKIYSINKSFKYLFKNLKSRDKSLLKLIYPFLHKAFVNWKNKSLPELKILEKQKNIKKIPITRLSAIFYSNSRLLRQASDKAMKKNINYIKGSMHLLRLLLLVNFLMVIIISPLFLYYIIKFKIQAEDNEKSIQSIFNQMVSGLILFRDKFIYVNPEGEKILGYPSEELINMNNWDIMSYEYKESAKSKYTEAIKHEGERGEFLYKIIGKNNEKKWVLFHSLTINYKNKPTRLANFVDVTERKNAEDKIKNLTRLYSTLSEINQLLLRVENIDDVYEDICRIAVEKGQFKMALCGFPDEQNSNKMAVKFYYGYVGDYLDDFNIYVDDTLPEGKGPAATAFREDKIVINNDTENNAAMLPWRDKALKMGFLSSASIPLKRQDKVIGIFNLYAGEKDFFDEKEVALLEELMKDVSFMINKIDLEKEINFISFYDTLTKLPNRNFFIESVNNFLERIEERPAAIILIDFYKLSYINNTFGYCAGDELLVSMADNLKNSFAATDIISRIGGDEFAIFVSNLADKDSAVQFIDKIKQCFEDEITVGSHKFDISYNIGVSIYPDNGNTATDLLKSADIALSNAKTQGENDYEFFTSSMNVKASEFLMMKKHLTDAFVNKEFVVYYQPYFKVDSNKTDKLDKTDDNKIIIDGNNIALSNRTIYGMEALMRWNSPDLGLVSPVKFIPLLEEMGLIRRLEEFLIEAVCSDLHNWKKMNLNLVPVSINISPVSFDYEVKWYCNPEQINNAAHIYENKKLSLADTIFQAIDRYALEYSLINIEVTEGLFIHNFDCALKILNKFKEKGMKIFIDDFGTGYSSLSYIKNIPADAIKIDISFIKSMMDNPKVFAIVNTIVELSARLGMETISEGVETVEQLAKLQSLGANMVQGYLFSKPVPEAEIRKIL